jgi:hypothetical protein
VIHRAWLLKSCKSQTFHGCPARVEQVEQNPLLLRVDACPANILAFGNTCPSDIQALKRVHTHNFMVTVLTLKPFLVVEDITRANNTYHLCKNLKKSIVVRQGEIQLKKEQQKNRRRQLTRRDASGNSLSNDIEAVSEIWISPRESKRPRSLQTIYDSLQCSESEKFHIANANKKLSKQARAGHEAVQIDT